MIFEETLKRFHFLSFTQKVAIYYFLLFQKAIDEVVRAARYPLSIIIVGVGDEDFTLMDRLDGDEERLYSLTEKRYTERDIVQFVPFNEFKVGLIVIFVQKGGNPQTEK